MRCPVFWLRAPLAGLLLWLAGCQTVPPVAGQPWPQQRAELQAIERFEFAGRIAVANGNEGFSAGLRWQQQGVASDLSVTAPLGVSALQIQFDGSNVRVIGSDGARLDGEQATEALQRALGFSPPLQSLRYWLLGCSDPSQPADEVLGEDQRLQSLQQAGWRVAYDAYQRAGRQWLPSRMVLNRDALRVRLVISRWQL
jgi:outer membrane lipoprotein LolB